MDETSLSLIKCPISHPQAASRFTCEREERASGVGEGEGRGGGGPTSNSPFFPTLSFVTY